jgi:uncharacterized protein involved in type VI secretion and phage assembly
MSESPRQVLHGKYRSVVASNIDPLQKGRLLVQSPDVLGGDSCLWALPALPVAGLQMGAYALPLVNAAVWVEFEQGDPDYPIWVGCWAGSAAELPALALVTQPPLDNFVLQTTGQNALVISDLPGPSGGLMLRSATATIIVNDTGIYLSNGAGAMITMSGPAVTVNQGALVVQ